MLSDINKYSIKLDDLSDLSASCSIDLHIQAIAMLNKFKAMGVKKGQTIKFGSTILLIRENNGNTRDLIVYEPDFSASDPINSWKDDLTQTLKVTRNQALLLKNIGLKNGECSFFEKIVVIKNILDYPNIYMQRQEVDRKRDSGWFIGYADRSHDDMDMDDSNNYESMYIYELTQKRPELLELICLPIGYIVVFENYAVKAILNNEDQVIFENQQASQEKVET